MLKVRLCLLLCIIGAVVGYPQIFETKDFRVGIEYDHSLPMYGGSDRFRHRNNYDPFFVTISTSARRGYVISYLEVSATVDAAGEVDFHIVRGQTGSKTMTFQLVSNNSDFLSYHYLAYGIKEDEYRKISNIITLPITNAGSRLHSKYSSRIFYVLVLLLCYNFMLR